MNEHTKALLHLIRGGENQHVEFKRKANHPEKIMKEVVAFANAQGGHLFVGIEDDGQLAGLKHPEEEEFILTKAMHELCSPIIDFEVEILRPKPDIKILHYHIKEGEKKPYFAFLEPHHKYGKAFIRVNDQSIQASYEVRQILKKRDHTQAPITFEETTRELFAYLHTNPNITVAEFSELTGMNKQLASNKLIDLALSGALKIEPREGADIFFPA